MKVVQQPFEGCPQMTDRMPSVADVLGLWCVTRGARAYAVERLPLRRGTPGHARSPEASVSAVGLSHRLIGRWRFKSTSRV
jgi:hypothetical protein